MTLDSRSMRVGVLALWAALFGWLWLSGETVRYLGPRTEWVVPVGALTLAAAALAYAAGVKASERSAEPLSLRESVSMIGLILPVLAAAVLAEAQLGSLAATNKLSSRGIDPSALAELASQGSGEVSFLELQAAAKDPRSARQLGISDGRVVRLLGFVSSAPGSPRAPFELTRFYVTCCAADAIPLGARIMPGPAPVVPFTRDNWLEVTGRLKKRGDAYVVQAARIERVTPPADPYLSFTY